MKVKSLIKLSILVMTGLTLLMCSKVKADTYYSSCAAINAEMAAQNMSDNTGSISQAYDCENGIVTVIAQINPQISSRAVLQATDSFINNYCLTTSKNYMLANQTDKELIKVMFRGGVKYIVRHNQIQDQVRTKSLEQCLEYVQIMETQLPENPYEQIKFIRTFNPKT